MLLALVERVEYLDSRNDKARDLFRSIMNMLDIHTKQLEHLCQSAESPAKLINDRSESELDNARSQIKLMWVFIASLTIVNIKPFLLDVWYLLHFIGHLIYSTGHLFIRHWIISTTTLLTILLICSILLREVKHTRWYKSLTFLQKARGSL